MPAPPNDERGDVPSFMGRHGARLLDNGYHVIPIVPGEKRPGQFARGAWQGMSNWTRFCTASPTEHEIETWSRWPGAGVGVACGTTVVLDIDILVHDLANKVHALAVEMLGESRQIRVGLWPKRSIFYRAETPFRGFKEQPIEILAVGQQTVAYHVHPETGRPYEWVDASLADTPIDELPVVTEAQCRAFLAAAIKLVPAEMRGGKRLPESATGKGKTHTASDLAGTREAVEEALEFIPNADLQWDDWFRMGMALKGALGDDGWPIFATWSAQSGKDQPAATAKLWRGLKPHSVGAGTIYWLAGQNGWTPSPWLKLNPTSDENAKAMPTAPPYYKRRGHTAAVAARRLRRAAAGFFDRCERILAARDWIGAEVERTTGLVEEELAARYAAKLAPKHGADAEDIAAERAFKVAKRVARERAKRAAVKRFGKYARCPMPRLQISGSAGLGKTTVFIEEYLKRPALWRRHIDIFIPETWLADEVAETLRVRAAAISPAEDGSRPRVIVIRGRQAANLCHRERREVVSKIGDLGASVHRSLCHTPAREGFVESFCPFWDQCRESGYISQFMDKGPALRLKTHARIGLHTPDDLETPPPDIVVVDENCIDALVTHDAVVPTVLTDLATYDSEPGEELRIQEAVDIGRIIVANLDDILGGLRGADMTAKDLRAAANAANLATSRALPGITAGMDRDRIRKHLDGCKPHPGRIVGAILWQIARDLDAGAGHSIAVEWDASNQAKSEDGSVIPHPVLRIHGRRETVGIPRKAGLLLLDADAQIVTEHNRVLFGADLRAIDIQAERQTYVIQITDSAMATVSIAPPPYLQQKKPAVLTAKITNLARRECAGGKRVLVGAPLKVRRVLTGESGTVPPVTTWCGAQFIHYGRHRGVDAFKDYDTVIAIGREQLPHIEAERVVRGIFANAHDRPLVILPKGARLPTQQRAHDHRHGPVPPVKVSVHPDPRVQALIELHREYAIGQLVDRLRPVHRSPDRPVRVVVVSNLPVPGLIVDELVTSQDLFAGGTAWQRLVDRLPDGVFPLVPLWMWEKHPDLFPSLRAAERGVAGVLAARGQNRQSAYKIYMRGGGFDERPRIAEFLVDGQSRWSRCLVHRDAEDAAVILSALLGNPVAKFRWPDVTEKGPATAPAPPERVDVVVRLAPTPAAIAACGTVAADEMQARAMAVFDSARPSRDEEAELDRIAVTPRAVRDRLEISADRFRRETARLAKEVQRTGKVVPQDVLAMHAMARLKGWAAVDAAIREEARAIRRAGNG